MDGLAKKNSIIKTLEEYFLKCDMLKDGCLRVDYLGEKPIEYAIEVLPCDPILKKYVNGDSVRQYLFAFGSKEFYSQERQQNIENSAFYERFSEWVEDQNDSGNLPVLPEGMEAEELKVISSGYLHGESGIHARYQIQLRLIYFKKKKEKEA